LTELGEQTGRLANKGYPIFPLDDFDLHYGTGEFRVGTVSTSPPDFRAGVAAATLSYIFGNRSIDHFRRRYVEHSKIFENKSTRWDLRIQSHLLQCNIHIDSVFGKLGERKTVKLGDFIAGWTLQRWSYSSRLMLSCAQRGGLFETAAIVRASFEQIAWAIKIMGMQERDAISALSPRSSVSSFRLIYPRAGQFYGWLSKHAHWEYDAHIAAMGAHEGKVFHHFAGSEFKALSLIAVFSLLDAYIAALSCYTRKVLDGSASDACEQLTSYHYLHKKDFIRHFNELSELSPEVHRLLDVVQLH
jgi:hypothetical protein